MTLKLIKILQSENSKNGLHPCSVGLWSQVQRELCVGWHLFTLPVKLIIFYTVVMKSVGLQYNISLVIQLAVTYIEKWLDIQQLNLNKYTSRKCAQHYQTNCLGYIQLSTRLLFLPLCSKTLQPDLLNSGYWVLNLHDVSGGGQQVYNQAASELTVQFC